jgi:hypothetical protein
MKPSHRLCCQHIPAVPPARPSILAGLFYVTPTQGEIVMPPAVIELLKTITVAVAGVLVSILATSNSKSSKSPKPPLPPTTRRL